MAVNINVPSQVKTYANLAAFPATGALKTIYIAEDTNKTYRWTGSVYVEISASAAGAAAWGNITGTLSNQTDLQNALNAKENTITAGTTSQYFRGDKTFQTLDKAAVGLGNVDNTSDANKPISTATQTALNAKQDTLTLTTTGTSGAATLVGSTLNIPQYSGGGSSPITNLGIGTTGTAVTGTTANTITQSVLIPANTLAANNTLDFVARFSKTGTAGAGNYRVYINTSNSLTGATLFANLYTVSSGATIPTHQNQRTFFYDGTTLSSNMGGVANVTDISQSTVTPYTMTYNSATAYYLIFAIQLSNGADSSVINGFRVLKYA